MLQLSFDEEKSWSKDVGDFWSKISQSTEILVQKNIFGKKTVSKNVFYKQLLVKQIFDPTGLGIFGFKNNSGFQMNFQSLGQ